MQPYVIKQGDYLSSLAHQFGFDADEIWNDPKNAPLRLLRRNQNILYPSDVLYIPDQNGPPAMQSLTTGTTNTFVSNAPTVQITLQFSEPSFASQAYTLQELAQLTGLTTDSSGVATFPVPVTLETATLVFTGSGATFACNVGALDPIDTPSGIFQRLLHLGFIDPSVAFDASNLGVIRAALIALKATQSDDSSPAVAAAPASESEVDPAPSAAPSDAGSTPPASARNGLGPPSSSSSAPRPPSDDGQPQGTLRPSDGDTHSWPPQLAPPSSPAVTTAPSPQPSDGSPASTSSFASSPASSPAPESVDPGPPSSANLASTEPPSNVPTTTPPPSPAPPVASASPPDTSGLGDDGTLDEATRQLLLQAHLS